MAEFIEVMVQMQRMCSKYGCNCFKCPLSAFGDCMLIFDDDNACDNDYAKIEDIVLQWAKENPEPVYPSWAKGWEQLYPSQSRNGFFPTAVDCMCPAYFGEKYRDKQCIKTTCSVCKNRPMPAEIAKKLGIKPKKVRK